MNDDLVKINYIENELEKNKEVVKIYLDYERKENEYSYNKEEKEFYLINKLWIKNWKSYVNYRELKPKRYNYYNHSKKNESGEASHPGPINNSDLLIPLTEFINDGNHSNVENQVINDEFNQREHIKILGKERWDLLFGLYGGGPEIKKKTIQEGNGYTSRNIVEIYYKSINIIFLGNRRDLNKEMISNMNLNRMYISRVKTLNDLKMKFIHIQNFANLNESNLRLWKISANSSLEEFKSYLTENLNTIVSSDEILSTDKIDYLEYIPNTKLKDSELADNDITVIEISTNLSPNIFNVQKIEIKEGSCEWCRDRKLLRFFCICKEVWYCSSSCKDNDNNYHERNCKKKFEIEECSFHENQRSRKGLVGLQNLGNTCFMNTALQCMNNCYELANYFLNDYYKKEINEDNPIGTGGALVRAYANLLKNVWFGDKAVYSPWNFKNAIGTYQSMFTGYQQHDTQEFLNYLLDGIHEDLNRVLKKPLVEKKDNKQDDQIKSQEEWIGFLKRNQSILVDLFYGQYKSTLYCPDEKCGNISTTFDPFLSLTLPLAMKREKFSITCYFIFYDIDIIPMELKIWFSNETTVMSLRNKVSKILDIHPFSFLVSKMSGHGVIDMLLSSTSLIKGANSHYHRNQAAFFLFQIDPKLFYSNENKYYNNQFIVLQNKDFSNIYLDLENRSEEINRLFNYDNEEDESGSCLEETSYYSIFTIRNNNREFKATKRLNVDGNLGLPSNYIKIFLYMKTYCDNSISGKIRKKLLFPRIIYLNKNWSLKYIHNYILKYFSAIVFRKLGYVEWDKIFGNYDVVNMEFIKNAFLEKNYPYIIRLINIFEKKQEPCLFCSEEYCDNCILPFSDTITLQDIIDKIPKNEGMDIDNNYFYMSERHRDYFNNFNRDVSLEITVNNDYEYLFRILNEPKKVEFENHNFTTQDDISIYNCFKNFIKLEKLQDDNEWYCPQCKTHQKATKKMEIYKAPHILIIHLKRFRGNSKIDSRIEFPIEGLDISQYVLSQENNTLIYDLFAISNHFGGLGGGHYMAFAMNNTTKKWYEFNDSHVSEIREDNLVTQAAYVLFYRRRSNINLDELYVKKFIDFDDSMDVS